jgi:hypothetical protein
VESVDSHRHDRVCDCLLHSAYWRSVPSLRGKSSCIFLVLYSNLFFLNSHVEVPLPESGGAKANVSLAYVCVIAFFGIVISLVGLYVGTKYDVPLPGYLLTSQI